MEGEGGGGKLTLALAVANFLVQIAIRSQAVEQRFVPAASRVGKELAFREGPSEINLDRMPVDARLEQQVEVRFRVLCRLSKLVPKGM